MTCTARLAAIAFLYSVFSQAALAVDITGKYRGGGVDSSARRAVLPDNTFCYALTAGSLDLLAAGRWQLEPGATRFSLIEKKPKTSVFPAFALQTPNGSSNGAFKFLGRSFSRSDDVVFAVSASNALPTTVRRLFAQDDANLAWSASYDLPSIAPADVQYYYIGHVERGSSWQGNPRLRMTQYKRGDANSITLAFDARQAMPLTTFEGEINGDNVQISEFRSKRVLPPQVAQQARDNRIALVLAAAGGNRNSNAPLQRRRDGSVTLVPVKEFDQDISAVQGKPWLGSAVVEPVPEFEKSSASPRSVIATPSATDSAAQSNGEPELEAAIEVLFKGQRTQAHADLYKALELVKQSGSTALIARAYYFIGVVEGDLGRDAQARDAFEKSRSFAKRRGAASLESFATRGLADLDEVQGNLAQARELYQEAIKLSEKGNDPKATANAQYGLAELEQRQSNSVVAMTAMRLSLATATKAKYAQGVVNAWAALGLMQLQAGLLDDAIKSYNAADKLHIQLRDRLGHARVKLGLGDIKKLQKKPTEARQYYEDANLLYLAEQVVVGQGNAQRRLARLYAEHPNSGDTGSARGGRSRLARQALGRAIELYKTADAPPGLATAYFELAEIDLGEKAYRDAAKNYGLALELYKARQDTSGQANALKRLGLIRSVADMANASAESLHAKAKAQIHSNPALAVKFWNEADQQFQKSLDANPEQPISLINWGIVLTNIAQESRRANLKHPDGLLNRALEKYDLSLQLNPNLISTIFEKGVTLQHHADAVEASDASQADALRQLAVAQYGQVLARTAEVLNAEPLTGAALAAAKNANTAATQAWAGSLVPQSRPNTAFELRHLRFGAANNWGNILQQQAEAMAKTDLPAARNLLQQSYGKFALATRIQPLGYDALSNWAAALMVERRALLGIEPIEAARLLTEARNMLLSQASQAPDILAYNLACTYALEGRAEDAVFWLERARLSGDAVRQSDILKDQDFNPIREAPAFMAWFKSIGSTQK